MDKEQKQVEKVIEKALIVAKSNANLKVILNNLPLGNWREASYSEVVKLEKTVPALQNNPTYLSSFTLCCGGKNAYLEPNFK